MLHLRPFWTITQKVLPELLFLNHSQHCSRTLIFELFTFIQLWDEYFAFDTLFFVIRPHTRTGCSIVHRLWDRSSFRSVKMRAKVLYVATIEVIISDYVLTDINCVCPNCHSIEGTLNWNVRKRVLQETRKMCANDT